MDPEQNELLDTIVMIQDHLVSLSFSQTEELRKKTETYLEFRAQVDRFLQDHFTEICTRSCYESKLSACCQRDGIIIFFADLVVNVLHSEPPGIREMVSCIQNAGQGFKCIFLGKNGCIWKIKPIVCQMFLCDHARGGVFKDNVMAGETWEALCERRKTFTWPDQLVIFDELERIFIRAGHTSSCMYYHSSPGLLKIKKTAKT